MSNRSLLNEVIWPLAIVLAGCTGSGGPGGVGSPTPSGVGRVEATLLGTGAPGNSGNMTVQTTGGGKPLGVKEIIVTISKVTAHSTSGGWVTLASTTTTVDILKLAQYAQQLGFANMPAGKITQVRLYVLDGSTNYVTRDDGVRVDLKVPSGTQSGIKLKGMFDVSACALTTVPMTFDGKHSIWVHPTGQGDEWILRPVIRMGKIEASNVGCSGPQDPEAPINPDTPLTPGNVPHDGTTPPLYPLPPNTTGTPTGGAGGGGGFDETGGTPGTTATGTPVSPTGLLGGAGDACTNGLGCLSGSCVGGLCATGGPDAPCNVALDCSSKACSMGACTVGSAGGTGAACTSNSQCMSNGCVSGVCGQGGQGQPCGAPGDCAIGFSCTAGSCDAIIN